jgi:RNA polymerase sigma-70 factor (ECF subfamily)
MVKGRYERVRVNETKLIEDLKAGDPNAQQAFYKQTVEPIYRLILRLTGSEADTFDLVQDTYVRAYQGIRKFRAASSVSTWLYQIALNESRQFLRRSSRRAEIIDSLNPAEYATSADGEVGTRLDVDDALTALAPADREILLLRYHEGFDYDRIADILDCAPGTVASRLHRARLQLRPALQKSYEIAEEK